MLNSLLKLRTAEEGATMVEFALVIPIFLLFIFGLIDISIMLYRWAILSYVTSETSPHLSFQVSEIYDGSPYGGSLSCINLANEVINESTNLSSYVPTRYFSENFYGGSAASTPGSCDEIPCWTSSISFFDVASSQAGAAAKRTYRLQVSGRMDLSCLICTVLNRPITIRSRSESLIERADFECN